MDAPTSKGLGATVAAFRKHNDTRVPPNPSAVPGLAWYRINSTSARGLVSSYTVTEDFKPAAGNATRMSLLSGIDLPGGPAEVVKQTSTCVDYRDPKLTPLLGVEYAEASTITGSTQATMQAVSSPGC